MALCSYILVQIPITLITPLLPLLYSSYHNYYYILLSIVGTAMSNLVAGLALTISSSQSKDTVQKKTGATRPNLNFERLAR